MRSFVPTSHGNGFRYDWKTLGPVAGKDLFDTVEDQKTEGWRVYNLSLAPSTSSGLKPTYDIIFVRDDDSNFNTGVRIIANEDLLLEETSLRDKNRRPIGIVHTSREQAEGLYTLVWIEDNKYQGIHEWRLVQHPLESLKAEVELQREEGFRPISATISSAFCTVIYVKDFAVDWFLAVFSIDLDDHPVSFLHANDAATTLMVPISMDCKFADAEGKKVNWVVVGCPDLDLDSISLPLVKWNHYVFDSFTSDGPPTATRLKSKKRRLHAIAGLLRRDEDGGHVNYYIVESRSPEPRCRIVYDENTVEDDLISTKPAGGVSVADFVNIAVLWYMRLYRIPALTLGIREGMAFRFRAGYTLAPLCYPLTYPETRFRIGSVSKVITALTTWKALQAHALDADAEVFPMLPSRWQPSLIDLDFIDIDDGYAPDIAGLRIKHVLTHTTGWSDKNRHPGGKWDAPWATAVAAGLPAEFSGWRTLNDEALLPLVRDDYMLFVLRREAFTRTYGSLEKRVGWDTTVTSLPADDKHYSGFAYDLLGAAIERLVGVEELSSPGADYAGLAEWTRVFVLAPMGMVNTSPARTPREWAHPDEATYRVDSYLEEVDPPTPGGGKYFSPTVLFTIEAWSTPQFVVDPEDSYNDQDHPIPATVNTPRYVADNYGGYRLESGLPRGGWISTAPDLCRMMEAYDAFSNALNLNPATVFDIRADPGGGGAYNLGGIQRRPGPFLGKRGTSRDATMASCNFHAGSSRIICVCRLLGTDDNDALIALVETTLAGWGL